MSTTTSRLGLTKPASNENYSLSVWNTNSDLIDSQVALPPRLATVSLPAASWIEPGPPVKIVSVVSGELYGLTVTDLSKFLALGLEFNLLYNFIITRCSPEAVNIMIIQGSTTKYVKYSVTESTSAINAVLDEELGLTITGYTLDVSVQIKFYDPTKTCYWLTISITGITANSRIDLQPEATIISLLISDKTSALYIANDGGQTTAFALENPPSVDLTIQATVTETTT